MEHGKQLWSACASSTYPPGTRRRFLGTYLFFQCLGAGGDWPLMNISTLFQTATRREIPRPPVQVPPSQLQTRSNLGVRSQDSFTFHSDQNPFSRAKLTHKHRVILSPLHPREKVTANTSFTIFRLSPRPVPAPARHPDLESIVPDKMGQTKTIDANHSPKPTRCHTSLSMSKALPSYVLSCLT